MNLNKVFLIGNLTADPELKTTPSGQSVATVRVATNRVWTDKSGQKQQDTQYHNVVLWGRQAEIVNQFLNKGSSIFIEGRLQHRTWQDKQGQTRYITEVVAENMQLGPRPAGVSAGGNKAFSPASPHPAANSPMERPEEEEIPIIDVDDGEIKAEDLPF